MQDGFEQVNNACSYISAHAAIHYVLQQYCESDMRAKPYSSRFKNQQEFTEETQKLIRRMNDFLKINNTRTTRSRSQPKKTAVDTTWLDGRQMLKWAMQVSTFYYTHIFYINNLCAQQL